MYKTDGQKRNGLSEYFAEDFKSFSKNVISLINILKRDDHDVLRSQKVFVPKVENIQIADVLFLAQQEEFPRPEIYPEAL